jgi:3-oxoacyl-[acyl-carrier protein] reductase
VDLGISGKVAVIGAASKGLGRASAEALAKEGVKLVLNARNAPLLEKTAEDIRAKYGVQIVTIAKDISRPDTAKELIQRALNAFGSVDIVIANAGGPPAKGAFEVTDTDIDLAVEMNFKSAVRLIKLGINEMRKTGWGRSIAITSSSIIEAIPSLTLSNSARIALWAWIKTAAKNLAEEDADITINAICPGSHATDRMKELGLKSRMGDPADFGSIVAFLASKHTKFLNGSKVVVDGGVSLCL